MSTTVWSSTAGTTVTQSLADQAETSATNAAASATQAATSAAQAAASATNAATSAAAGLAKVSSNDTTAAVLSSKIVGDGSTLTVTETNDGSNETLTLSTTGLQAADATLTALAGLTVSADQMIYATGSDAFATTGLTSAGRALLDDNDAAAQRTTLGLGTAATSASTAFLASASPTVSSGTLTLTSSGLTFSDGTTQTTASSGGGGGSSLTIADEGSDLSTAATKIDFVGAGVTASGTGANKTVMIPGGSGITVQDEGSALSTLGTTLNFVGSGVTASGNGATKTITISSGGSGNFVPVTGGTFTGNLGIEKNGATALTLTRTNSASNFAEIEAAGSNGEQLTIKSNVSNQTGGFTAFDVGGSERMRIDSGGNVGIGTTSPAAKIHVDAPNTTAPSLTFGASAGQIFQNENSELAIGLSSSSPYPLYMQGRTNANAERDISLQPLGGNVGIGTTSPSQKLEVLGSAMLKGVSTEPRFLEIGTGRTGNGTSFIDLVGDGTYTDYGARFIRAHTGPNATTAIKHRGTGELRLFTEESAPIAFRTNNAERVRIDSSGNVGIGTTNPSFSNSNLKVTRGITAINGPSTSPYLQLYNDNAGTDQKTWRIGGIPSGDLTFETVNDAYSASISRMRINSAGNVGIGTSSPDFKLDVHGPDLGQTSGDTADLLQIYSNNGNASYLNFQVIRTANGTNWTSAGTQIQQVIDTTKQGYIQFNGPAPGGVSFGSNTTESMRINQTGDITFHRGVVNLQSTSGNPAQMNFYCESGNAHYTRIQSSPHASYSGNVVLTLPTTSGTLATTGKAIAMAIVFG